MFNFAQDMSRIRYINNYSELESGKIHGVFRYFYDHITKKYLTDEKTMFVGKLNNCQTYFSIEGAERYYLDKHDMWIKDEERYVTAILPDTFMLRKPICIED